MDDGAVTAVKSVTVRKRKKISTKSDFHITVDLFTFSSCLFTIRFQH